MARKTRVEFENATYHVMARGNNRDRIFLSDKDCDLFLNVIAEAVTRFQVKILSYCLMTNHYHLALETPEANLSRAMAWIQTTFSVRYRIAHKRVGHIFQGRYKAELVEANDYLKTLLIYIHLNPIRSRKSGKLSFSGTYQDLEAFRWSSHSCYEGRRTCDYLDLKYLRFWGDSDKDATRFYRNHIKQCVSGEPEDWHDHVSYGMVAGGEKFAEQFHRILNRKPMLGRETGGRENMVFTYEKRKERLCKSLGEIEDQRIVIWARVKLLGERPTDLAKEYNYRDGSAITQIVKRTEARAEMNKTINVMLSELGDIASVVID